VQCCRLTVNYDRSKDRPTSVESSEPGRRTDWSEASATRCVHCCSSALSLKTVDEFATAAAVAATAARSVGGPDAEVLTLVGNG
jgi:hypothetical protein